MNNGTGVIRENVCTVCFASVFSKICFQFNAKVSILDVAIPKFFDIGSAFVFFPLCSYWKSFCHSEKYTALIDGLL